MTPLSLIPRADDEVFIDRSQPEPAGIRSCRRYAVVPFHRNGTENAPESWPTTHPSALTARAEPWLVPTTSGICTVPVAFVQTNGRPLNPLAPTTCPPLPTPNARAVVSPDRGGIPNVVFVAWS